MYKHPTSITPFLASLPAAVPTENAVSTAITTTGSNNRSKLQNVPAFLNKLYCMVDDSTTDDLIRWSDDGASFIVVRHEDFARTVLPRFFKHSNFSSFVRQLNMYGFHKIPHMQQGVLQADDESERWEFSNPHFQRNQPDLLLLVTRKKGREADEKEPGNVDLQHILDEISAIKKHQTSLSANLQSVQNDNQLLWQETLQSRERHQRHQETIDKILRFLASVFSGDKKRVVIPQKRRFLIGDANTEYETDEHEEQTKKRKTSPKPDIIQEFVNTEEFEGDQEELALPPTLAEPDTSNPPTSELAAAIALNNQTKEQSAHNLLTTPTSAQDLSTLLALSQLPELQTIVAFAQSNPAFFQHLNNTSYGAVPDFPGLASSSSSSTPSPPSSSLSPNNTTASAPQDTILAPQNFLMNNLPGDQGIDADMLYNLLGMNANKIQADRNSSDLHFPGMETLFNSYTCPPAPDSNPIDHNNPHPAAAGPQPGQNGSSK